MKSRSKIAFFQMSAILKFDFQKRKRLRFSEVNYLNYTHTHKKLNFACDNYIFPKTRGNKNKKWTHSTLLKLFCRGSVIFYSKWHVKQLYLKSTSPPFPFWFNLTLRVCTYHVEVSNGRLIHSK